STPAQPAYYASAVNQPRGGKGAAIAAVVVAVLVVIVCAAVLLRPHNRSGLPAGIDLTPDQMRQIREFEGRVSQPEPAATTPSLPDPNSPESEARREIKRLEDKGIVPTAPPPDSEGRIHLQSGGTISPEEWERARQSL